MSAKKVLVIGETCKDIFRYGVSNRLAPEAPAPVFLEVSRSENPGMAMNVKRNIESLGIQCDIWTNKNWESITKTRYIDDRTNHMFIRIDENDEAYGRINFEDFSINSLQKYDAVIISDYNKGFLQAKDIDLIAKNHPFTILDSKKQLGIWCNNLSFIKINSPEYEKSKSKISENISDKLIVTLGSKGCRFQNKVFDVKNVSVRDVSGAGDTFVSAFVVKMLETNSIEESLKFANDCATVVVQKRGVSTL